MGWPNNSNIRSYDGFGRSVAVTTTSHGPQNYQEIADDLIETRQAGMIGDLKVLLGENDSLMAPYIYPNTGFSGSNTYTFETSGYLYPEETGYGIRAVVRVRGARGFNYLYYKSPADIRHDRYDKN